MSGEYYVFVNDAETNLTVCHQRPELIGQDQSNLADASGKLFIREMAATAFGSEKGGWVEYLWPRSGETEPVTKIAYVVGVTAPDGTRYVVGSGTYE